MPYENKATAKHNWYLLPQPTLKTFYPIAGLFCPAPYILAQTCYNFASESINSSWSARFSTILSTFLTSSRSASITAVSLK